eukprot:4554769-Amphidinium_carterae.1
MASMKPFGVSLLLVGGAGNTSCAYFSSQWRWTKLRNHRVALFVSVFWTVRACTRRNGKGLCPTSVLPDLSRLIGQVFTQLCVTP